MFITRSITIKLQPDDISIMYPTTISIYIRGVYLSTGSHNELPVCRCGAVTLERVAFSGNVQVNNGKQQSDLFKIRPPLIETAGM
jgi:hypothetical protein